MSETEPTVVVLTALPSEYAAVRAHIPDAKERVHEKGTFVEWGRLPDSPWQVAIAELGPGALNAASLTERIVNWLRPEVLLFVGVAGSLERDDIKIGDVVVGTKVYSVHGGKQTREGFLVRPEAWHSSHRLEQVARFALRGKAHLKPIAVGDVVLADARSDVAEYLHKSYNDAAAIEMEGSGVVHAAHLSGQLDALVIRGISDYADAKKAKADASGSQPKAADAAAAAAVAILRKHRPARAARSETPAASAASDDSREGPFPRSQYGGDHLDFRGSTFSGPFTAKKVVRGRDEDAT
ncbi:5'-methylthioadenosine/S-adenosylhomocysteine nucleosidase family protein [Streptomyces sp. GQFP]|uniref:5'-methylthioadenosine/S-adenosylhomocysteine nucleosidase family protein n=1 Tax=Streptomyces sp. GQFP TaxID=2907545 RepID=UPI001F1BDD1D|nr:5'-methylthioadenosine/S-adenosylhomocysteine nucleosidase [Streptomyces sp. GQFP]UIX30674.1 5'-methylthioadenosine/S-adenosylhomocysteine nucleosidase [Streptomyces sp. GQFP]